MSKKTFYIILLIIAGLIIIGGLIWYFIFKPSPIPTTAPQGAGFTLPGQETATGKLLQISENRIVSAHFSDDDTILFYD
ncbi:MAG: hypothetical protein AAB789_00850, partial [Patescibacteria group bacterium]